MAGEHHTGRTRVAVLMGGPSPEHEVSLKTGSNVIETLDRKRYDILPVLIGRDGAWRLAQSTVGDGAPFSVEDCFRSSPALQAGTAVSILKSRGIAACFIALHGPFGEDGVLQGLLTACSLPYTGSDTASSALAMDKIATKAVLSYSGIPVAEDEIVGGPLGAFDRPQAERVASRLGLPCVVKEPGLGSSFGVYIAGSVDELIEAAEKCGVHRKRVLVERYVKGTELTCGVLRKPGTGSAQALPVTLIRPRSATFFDYEAKYTPGATDEITPAPIDEDVARQVRQLSVQVFELLGCDGMARVDFILEEGDGGLKVLEINTIPGLTETSLLPQQAAAAGMSFSELLSCIVERALERARDELESER